jgi:hypothetical protein
MGQFAKRFFLCLCCLSLLLTGYGAGAVKQAEAAYDDSRTIPHPPGMVLEGAAAVGRQADVQNSPYYPRLDFYNMKSGGSLTILENFKTFQDTTEVTDGPACIIMLLEHYGMYKGQSDRELYDLRANKENPKTTLKDMIHILESLGDWNIYSTYDLEDPNEVPLDLIVNSLKENKPVLIGDNEWGGHWRIIIGYDDMGDDLEENDVLILADSYDTTDHYQDGYSVASFERLYYNWINGYDPEFSRNIFLIAAPK